MTAAAFGHRRSIIRRDSLIRLSLRAAVLIVILAAWQAAGDDANRLTLPTFTGTMRAFGEMTLDGSLPVAMFNTTQALVGGFALALAIGIPLGIVMGNWPAIGRVGWPYLLALLAVPMIAISPIIQIVFGLTLVARIVIVFVFAFIYITVNTMVGVRSVEPSLREMGASFCASEGQMLRHIIFPAATPAIMAGIRLGLGRALIGMVVAELTLVGGGIGSLIQDYRALFQPSYVFALIVAILLQGVLLMAIARRVEGRLSRWEGSGAIE